MLRQSKPMLTTRSKIPPQVKNLNNWLIREVAYKIGHLLKTDLKTPIPQPKENPPVPAKKATGTRTTMPRTTTKAGETIKTIGNPGTTKKADQTPSKPSEPAILIIEEAATPTTAEATIKITGNPETPTTEDQGKKITGGQATTEDPMIIENQAINLRANLPGPGRLM